MRGQNCGLLLRRGSQGGRTRVVVEGGVLCADLPEAGACPPPQGLAGAEGRSGRGGVLRCRWLRLPSQRQGPGAGSGVGGGWGRERGSRLLG